MDIAEKIQNRKHSESKGKHSLNTGLVDIALDDNDSDVSDDGWLEDSDNEWSVRRNDKESSDEFDSSNDDFFSMEADEHSEHTQGDVLTDPSCPKIVRVYSLSEEPNKQEHVTDNYYAVSKDTDTVASPHFSVPIKANEYRNSLDDANVSLNKSRTVQLQQIQATSCGEIISRAQYSVDEYVGKVMRSMCADNNEQMVVKGPASVMYQITHKNNADCKNMGVSARPVRETEPSALRPLQKEKQKYRSKNVEKKTKTPRVRAKTGRMKMKVSQSPSVILRDIGRRSTQVPKDLSPYRSRADRRRTSDAATGANCSTVCDNAESPKSVRQTYNSRREDTSSIPDGNVSLEGASLCASKRVLFRDSRGRFIGHPDDDIPIIPGGNVSVEEASLSVSKRVLHSDSTGQLIGHPDDDTSNIPDGNKTVEKASVSASYMTQPRNRRGRFMKRRNMAPRPVPSQK